MTFKLTTTLFIVLTFVSCEKTKIKRLKVENLIAEGEISKDTVYNGFIKFYDASTNNLVETAIYKSGELNGLRILYYPNGKTRISTKYSNGKSNGETKVFDTTGNIVETQNSYYNLRVGQSLQYKKGQVSQYHFYSLENKELLHIDYDSIQGKRVEQLNDSNFFFWHLDNYITSESKHEKTELFLYLPNPQKLNFKYLLCLIDNKHGNVL